MHWIHECFVTRCWQDAFKVMCMYAKPCVQSLSEGHSDMNESIVVCQSCWDRSCTSVDWPNDLYLRESIGVGRSLSSVPCFG